jgi:hypothetical protein
MDGHAGHFDHGVNLLADLVELEEPQCSLTKTASSPTSMVFSRGT